MATDDDKVKRDHGDGGLVIIPAAIMQMDMPLKPKVLFGAIWALVQMKAHKCWASNRRLAEIIGSKVDFRYWEAMRTLEQRGLIARSIDRKRQREEIRVTWEPDSLMLGRPPARIVQTPTCTDRADPPCTDRADHRSIESEKRGERKDCLPVPCSSPSASRANGRRKSPDELEAERRRQHAALDARFPPKPEQGS